VDDSFDEAVIRPRVASEPLVEPLTHRETEVLQLLAQGLTNRRIGERLGISEHTAKFHVNAILGKLGAQTRGEAIAHAARLGLLLL
jgi:DNA-binding CsgD family transcriptional regulator